MFICQYCSRECKNHNSLRNHQRLCKLNPERQTSPFENYDIQNTRKRSNQFLSGKCVEHSEETRKKIAASSSKQVMSASAKKKLSVIAKERGLGGHTSKQRLYFEKNNGEVVYLQSSYEIKFAQLLEDLGIEWSRPEPLKWFDENGEDHKYYPDFKIGEKYFDTKNDYLIVKDSNKIERVAKQNNVIVEVVTYQNITKEYIINALLV